VLSRSWGLNAGQPEDDERERYSGRRRIREIEMVRRKEKEREREMQTRAIHKGRGKKTPKKKRLSVAHTSKDGGDRTAPSIDGYI
jgi:hypothetical protein